MRGLPLLVVAFLSACGEDAASPALDAGPNDAGGERDAAQPEADAGPQLGAVCDARLAASCAAGEKCVTTRWALEQPWPETRCVPDLAAQGKLEDEACFSSPGYADGCGSGLSCTNFGSGEGFCRRTCARGEPCGDGDVCVSVAASGFALCLQSCTDDDSCEAPGWLRCGERAGVHYCESTRAQ